MPGEDERSPEPNGLDSSLTTPPTNPLRRRSYDTETNQMHRRTSKRGLKQSWSSMERDSLQGDEPAAPGTLYKTPSSAKYSPGDLGISKSGEFGADVSVTDRAASRMCTVILSKIVESVRFSISVKMLHQRVSLESLEALLRENASNNERDSEAQTQRLRSIWTKLEALNSRALHMTYQHLLDYECPVFPESTSEQRRTLREIAANNTVVFKDDVEAVLELGPESALIQYLFASGAVSLPGEIFQDIVGTLSSHPRGLSFSHYLSEYMINTGRRMMTLLPYLILLAVTLANVPFLANVKHMDAMQTTLHFLEADWAAGCPYNTTSIRGCNFIQRNMNTLETVQFDAMRFIREELILRLWSKENETASAGPLGYIDAPGIGSVGSTFLHGALVLRLTDAIRDEQLPKTKTCGDLNLTSYVRESLSVDTFGCDAMWSAVIPFSETREAALAAASTLTTDLPVTNDASLIAQFASYQPSSGFFIYTWISLTIPLGGHVLPRVEIRVSDSEAHKRVMPMFVTSCVFAVVSLLFALFYRINGRGFWRPSLFFDLVLVAVISAGYGILRSIDFPVETHQDLYVPQNADWAATNYTRGLITISMWCMFAVGLSARYLREVGALHIVVAILQHAALEIIAMTMIFGIWTLTFAHIAFFMFGGTSSDMASNFALSVYLFDFFSGGSDYDHLTRIHPVLGPMFWFTFTIFVSFFALNLLIAVLTAPLSAVKEASNLDTEVNTECYADVESDRTTSRWSKMKHHLIYWFTPLINIFADAAPVPKRKLHWMKLEICTRILFSDDSDDTSEFNVDSVMEACETILDLLNSDNFKNHPYETPLVRKVVELEAMDPISEAMTILSLASMSSSDVFRDARLNRVLIQYDIFTTNINIAVEMQHSLKIVCTKNTDPTVRLNALKKRMVSRSSSVIMLDESTDMSTPAGHSEANDSNEKYNFTKHVEWFLFTSRVRAITFFIILFSYAVFMYLGFNLNNDSAFLAASLKEGLRDFPIHQECYDENCSSAFSFRKTFMDTADLVDFHVWVDKVLHRQLYLRQDVFGDVPPGEAPGMMWDRRTKRISPLYFRQLRTPNVPCKFDSTSAAYTTGRVGQLLSDRRQNRQCSGHADDGFSTADIAPPGGVVPPLVDRQAYSYRDTCIEERKPRHYGILTTYPCAGYTAQVNTSAELNALMDARWFDNTTRLIVLSTKFQSGNAEIEIAFYLELGEGGGSAYPSVVVVSLSESRETIEAMFILGICTLSVDAFVYIIISTVNLVRQGRNFNLPMLPFPTGTVVLYIFVFVLPYIAYQTPTVNERLKVQLAVVSIAFTFTATEQVFFPLAGLLSKSATKLFDTLRRSALQCALLIPFYIVFLTALAASGMILFGTNVPKFALFRYALVSVFRGALGNWQTEDLSSKGVIPEVVEFYNLVFYFVVLIMLANLVLAMVTSAAGDALLSSPQVDIAERLCRARGWHLLFGGIFEFTFAWNVHKARNMSTAAVRPMAPVSVGDERLLFIQETLVLTIGPNRANEVLQLTHLDVIQRKLFPSAVVHLMQLHADFTKNHPVLESLDRERETFSLRDAHERQFRARQNPFDESDGE